MKVWVSQLTATEDLRRGQVVLAMDEADGRGGIQGAKMAGESGMRALSFISGAN